MSVGKRLAEERKRMGLSQAVFAERVGVSFSSQRRYEDGRSSPDTGYLEAIGNIGVDVDYVLFNINGNEIVDCPVVARMASQRAKDGMLVKPFTMAECRNMASGLTLRQVGKNEKIKQWFDDCQSCPLNPVRPRVGEGLEESEVILIAAIFEGVELAIARLQVALEPTRKARVVAMLYRSFKASGKIDSAMIDDAVKLALA